MSYCIYIGRNHTTDGHAYLAGYGDEPSSHWLSIVPRRQHAADATVTVGVTPQALMPGKLTEIPQAAETARHICVSYSHYRGVPAPLTNGGINEHGVAVRDVWSTSCEALIALTPAEQTGPNYSDLARIVIERAQTAREGVEIIGQLIAEHGYSTYGGNSHFIADHNEGWVVIEFAGGQGLWAAERVGPDAIRASRPGYIEEIPADFAAHPDFMGPDHLIQFAIDQGWYDAAAGEPFNINKIYGDGKGRWAGVQWVEHEMQKRAGNISLADVMWAVRTPHLTGDTAGYGQVVPLRAEEPAALRMLWHTATGAISAPFVPVYLGSADVPLEFQQHRYLTDGEAARFSDANRKPDAQSHVPQGIESTRSAFRTFKRLMYLILEQHETYLSEAIALFEAYEAHLIAGEADVRDTAQILISAERPDLAQRHLTYVTHTELNNVLAFGETLAASLEARTRIQFGVRTTPGARSHPQIW